MLLGYGFCLMNEPGDKEHTQSCVILSGAVPLLPTKIFRNRMYTAPGGACSHSYSEIGGNVEVSKADAAKSRDTVKNLIASACLQTL